MSTSSTQSSHSTSPSSISSQLDIQTLRIHAIQTEIDPLNRSTTLAGDRHKARLSTIEAQIQDLQSVQNGIKVARLLRQLGEELARHYHAVDVIDEKLKPLKAMLREERELLRRAEEE